MDRVLTVDAGNSWTKATLFEEGKKIEKLFLKKGSLVENCHILLDWSPDKAIVASSGDLSEMELDYIAGVVNGNILRLDQDTRLPIEVDYRSDTLGQDRIAAACGAAFLYPELSAFIVDAGTALTLDVLAGGKVFKGGNISPGVKLRFKSLHDETAALPLVRKDSDLTLWGDDTFSAIRNGVVNGLTYEIYVSALLASRQDKCDLTVMTGGDSSLIYNRLSQLIREYNLEIIGQIVCEPDLVAYGLLNICNFNENN